ncbi:MAG: hypothetical protein HKN09_11220 [Saprospiraceae bacterium]|nr:hypothetical protein [Saprospiraceae bacterium]
MKIFYASIILMVFVFLGACQSEQKVPLNPNGDSELAILMREMFEEGMNMKEAIAKGEHPKVKLKFKDILTADATEPDKAASDVYKAYAQSYISIMEGFENGASNPEELYESMVSNCESCHKALCPGPLVRIKKLKV